MRGQNQRSYTDEFREQIAKLVMSGKSAGQIAAEYGISKATVNAWTSKYTRSGSFRDADNRTPEEAELIRLRKDNKQLRMEVDLLKQCALIMARR